MADLLNGRNGYFPELILILEIDRDKPNPATNIGYNESKLV